MINPLLRRWIVLAAIPPLFGLLAFGARAADSQPQLSERQQSLLLQLSDAEANIRAPNLALTRIGYKVGLAYDRIDAAQSGNDIMNRKGGGPVGWQDFYGKTARSFYIPDSVGTLHASGGGRRSVDVKVAEGLHPIERPAQFDSIYKANNDQIARAKAQASALAQDEATLLARRQKHEQDQSRLWATLAWERVKDREIADEPICRFKLVAAAGPNARLEVLRAVVLFLRTADRATTDGLDSIEADQEGTVDDLNARMKGAYAAVRISLADAALSSDLTDQDKKQVDDLKALCKQLSEEASIIDDNYRSALDRDRAKEDNSKLVFREQLQESLARFSGTVAELDDRASESAKGWGITVDKSVPTPDQLPARLTRLAQANEPQPNPRDQTAVSGPIRPTADKPERQAQAAIIVSTPSDVKVLNLARGAARLYDANPVRRIDEVAPALHSFQFTSIPQRHDITYEIHVRKPTTIYVFGFRALTRVSRADLFGSEAGKWEDADDTIKGKYVTRVFRRKVAPGEVIQFKWFEASIAADSIELAR